MGRLAIWQDAMVERCPLKQKPGPGPGFPLEAFVRPRYATLLNALFTPFLIGSAVSVATFWASAPSSLLRWVKASNCLRAWALDSSMTSDRVLAVINSPAKSNAAFVLMRAASIIFRP